MQDIRLAVGWVDHPKVQKLKMKLGSDAVLCLIRLWSFCANHRQNGKLVGMSTMDIELAARWEGAPGAFSDGLLDIGWLDVGDGYLELHDWRQYQPWIYFAKERSEAAAKAAYARWNPRKMNKPNGICCFSDCENPGTHLIGTRLYCDNPSHRPVKGYE